MTTGLLTRLSASGGGAQRSARNASGSKSKPPKPPVRMESMPPPEVKHLNIAGATLLPQSASVAMDPSAMLGAHSTQSISATAAAAAGAAGSPAASSPALAQLQKPDIEMVDRATGASRHTHMLIADSQAAQSRPHSHTDDQSHQANSTSATSLPQSGLTVSPHRVLADGDRPLSRLHSKASSSKNGRKSSTPRGNTLRASVGRPPRRGSGSVNRQDSSTVDKKDSRKLLRRNTTG